jgi:hypothetical protein
MTLYNDAEVKVSQRNFDPIEWIFHDHDQVQALEEKKSKLFSSRAGGAAGLASRAGCTADWDREIELNAAAGKLDIEAIPGSLIIEQARAEENLKPSPAPIFWHLLHELPRNPEAQ